MIGFSPGAARRRARSRLRCTIAAFGELLKTLLTDVLKSVCSAPDLPPAMLFVSPMIFAIIRSAVFTDGSVHLILCFDSGSYFAGPAVRR